MCFRNRVSGRFHTQCKKAAVRIGSKKLNIFNFSETRTTQSHDTTVMV